MICGATLPPVWFFVLPGVVGGGVQESRTVLEVSGGWSCRRATAATRREAQKGDSQKAPGRVTPSIGRVDRPPWTVGAVPEQGASEMR